MIRIVISKLILLSLAGSVGAQQLSFSLPDSNGEWFYVAPDSSRLTVVCFLGTECPMARAYVGRLNELNDRYASLGVRLYGIMSNSQDSPEDVKRYVAETVPSFTVLVDDGGAIAKRFGATRTPEAFLLDAELKLRYHGRIDGQYMPGVARAEMGREDLRLAIDELLAGKPVSVKETRALGCIIGKPIEAAVSTNNHAITYYEHVVPVLQRNCIECHRAGEIGPFAMDRYEEVVGWSYTMLETIEDRRMPPWHADPSHGQFVNERIMPERDKQILRDWVAGGAIEGEPVKRPAELTYTSGWQLDRAPDLILEMRERPFVVPRDGVVEYQYFVVDPGFSEDKWVQGAQVVPGSRDVVHHAIVFVRPPDGSEFQGVGWLTAYVPGQRVMPMPEGHARLIPAGSKLIFQMHYTPNGTERKDVTRIGLQFADESQVTDRVFTLMALNQDFEIPPEASEHRVTAELPWIPRNGELLAVTPHMHFRGKSFSLSADRAVGSGSIASKGVSSDPTRSETGTGTVVHEVVKQNDTEEILLRVPDYDFNWQHTYQFANPVRLDGLSGLHFEATFDNSANNPFNPDPSEWVSWGDQTWEEMAVTFFEVSVPRAEDGGNRRTARNDDDLNGSDELLSEEAEAIDAQVETYVRRVLDSMDKNHDGVVRKSEASIVVRRWNFWRWDLNRDEIVTEDEIRQVAKQLYQ